jgi:hypothetical protein
LAEIYQAQGNRLLAEQTLHQGLSLAVRQRLQFRQSRFYTLLGQLEGAENKANALRYYERALSSGEAELSADSLHWLQQVIADLKRAL